EYIISKKIDDWDVYIAGLENANKASANNEWERKIGQLSFIAFGRSFEINNDSSSAKMIRIEGSKVKVGAGLTARVGLTKEEYSIVQDKVRERNHKRSLSDSDLLNIKGRKPLLVLYPVYPKTKMEQIDDYIFALGLGFPGEKQDKTGIKYMINLVKARELTMELENDNDE
ncbi:MAG: hypothetical protein HUJ61_02850, partial [Bacilli bacterium]|nr:hypothetical protein [Bacilli bacterium]